MKNDRDEGIRDQDHVFCVCIIILGELIRVEEAEEVYKK